MKMLPVLLTALAVVTGQTGTTVSREGAYWTQVTTGSIAAPTSTRLRVSTRGPLIVQGAAGDSVSYTLRKRVKAGNEAQARRYFDEIGVKARTSGEWTYLSVIPPSSRRSGANTQIELTITAPRGLKQVALETEGGNIEAYDLQGQAQAETGGGRVRMDRIGGGASIKTAGGEIQIGKITGDVRSLSGGGSIRADSVSGEAWLETAGGEIFIREAMGPVRASTAGGNIHVDRAASTVSARTAGGLIEVVHAGGLVTADTSGGSIEIGAAKGVRCESAAGAIRLRGVSGALRASTAAGNIVAELLTGSRLEDSSLNTDGGDITVLIPSNLAVTVRAQNESGYAGRRIVSDFPEIRIRPEEMKRIGAALAEGALNGGGPLLRITVSGGTIYLRRRN